MKRFVSTFFLVLLPSAVFPQQLSSVDQRPSITKASTVVPGQNSLVNINDVSLWVSSNGVTAWNPRETIWGFMYPRGTAGVVYADNLVWVGVVKDGASPAIRTGGGLWTTSIQPGVILPNGNAQSISDPANRVYRVRKDYHSADLREDASEFFDTSITAVLSSQVELIRAQYDEDWHEWPWQKGAPFCDINNNGIMDGDDYPGFQNADQVLWFACNDLSPSSLFGAPQIGLEVQSTIWAYDGVKQFQNVVFKRYQIIYKGTLSTPANARIDSMYICQWADTQVGSEGDDLAGCDSVLSMAFGYNSKRSDSYYAKFSLATPAVGYLILQGPTIPGGPSDEAIVGFEKRYGFKNLSMTSCIVKPTPSSFPEQTGYSMYWWNTVRGYFPNNDVKPMQLSDPWGAVTKFALSGDPFTNIGWIDGKHFNSSFGLLYDTPGGRRLFISTGPFSMALGDTQEVVIAVIAGLGSEPARSVNQLKFLANQIRQVYPDLASWAATGKADGHVPFVEHGDPEEFSLGQNFPNPFNPSTSLHYSLPTERDVRLAVYDLLGRELVVLDSGHKLPGEHSVTWDGRDNLGRQMPSGVYFYKLEAGSVQLTKKMLLIR